MKDWLESEDLKFLLQISNFNERIVPLAGTFNLTPAQLSAIDADAKFAAFIISKFGAADQYKQDWTKLKDQVRYGIGGDVLSPYPTPVNVSMPPMAVTPNVEKRFRQIVAQIKSNTNYTRGIGEGLGIEAPEPAPIDWNTITARISDVSVHFAEVIIEWIKGKSDGVRIYTSYDGNNWTLLGTDMKSPFEDTRKNRTSEPETRFYKVVYLKDDKIVGHESAVVKVVVNIQ